MSEILNRFSLQSATWNSQVAVCVLILWLVIVGCAISSIRAMPFSAAQRRFWIVMVVGFPIIGLLAYVPFSFRREDLPNAFMMKAKHRNRKASKHDEATSGDTPR
jgi:uncharacterized membrane protein YhaH (DUF805 family)